MEMLYLSPIWESFFFLIIIVGIGLIALPTGVIASGFLEELRASKEGTEDQTAPHLADEIRKLKLCWMKGLFQRMNSYLGSRRSLNNCISEVNNIRITGF